MNKYQFFWLFTATISLLASLFFAYLFYEFYWQWCDLFYENGRYFDEINSVVYHSESKFYAIPCIFFLLISIELFRRLYQDLN